MPRLKLKRFRVQEPPPAVQAQYIRFYSGRDLYFNAEQLPQITSQALFGVEAPMVFDLGSSFWLSRRRCGPTPCS